MQWMLTEKREGIGHAMYVENGAIWPKTVGRGREEKKE